MPLRAECFRELNSRKYVARSAVASLLAWLVQDDHTANKLLENILRKRSGKPITARCGSFLISFENIPHEEVFRGCTIIGIFFDSCIAKARQANRHEMLFERSEFIE